MSTMQPKMAKVKSSKELKFIALLQVFIIDVTFTHFKEEALC